MRWLCEIKILVEDKSVERRVELLLESVEILIVQLHIGEFSKPFRDVVPGEDFNKVVHFGNDLLTVGKLELVSMVFVDHHVFRSIFFVFDYR